ncbi:MAG: hypothetical protein NVS4B5_03630 [Vulcanimicrobiaceae bacterium]
MIGRSVVRGISPRAVLCQVRERRPAKSHTMIGRDVKDALQRLAALAESGSRGRRARLRTTEFTVVSNDCWGAEVYKDLNLPFQTPLIGTFLAGPCYMRLVSDCSRILRSQLDAAARTRCA